MVQRMPYKYRLALRQLLIKLDLTPYFERATLTMVHRATKGLLDLLLHITATLFDQHAFMRTVSKQRCAQSSL